ncbi:hypothetical protein WJX72_000837 [[Myrmecia] bisecta]|uniref:GrpE protein homolog n=1 Tax=[Myrmecia] bisecta TaxID=41462 RepID=A0AAW1R4B0_9CHLO
MTSHKLSSRQVQQHSRWQTYTKKKKSAEHPVAQEPEPEIEAPEATSEASTSEPSSAEEAPSASLSLLDQLKQALADAGVDESVTGDVLPSLESEFLEVEARAAAAEDSFATCEADLQRAKEQYIRLNADFDNFRKRSANEKASLADSVRGDVVVKLVPLVDSFEQAKGAIKAESDAEQKIETAYQGIYKQMVEIFRSLGVEAVPGVGAPFDPNFHDAIMREANEDVPDGTVLQEFRKGFRVGDKLLRPAMVKVSYSEAPAAPAANGNAPQEAADAAAESVNVDVEA